MDSRTGLPVVGMVGAGQLARMTHQAAIALGQSLRVLAAHPDDGAALVAADVRLGEPTDLSALREFAKGCTAVTFDHEHVPAAHIRALVAEGVTVLPGPDALIHAQDKQVMRAKLTGLGIPVPRWSPVGSAADVRAFAGGLPGGDPDAVIVKAARGGYDGKGVWVVPPGDVESTVTPLLAAGTPLIVEERVALRRELAVVLARSPYGQVAVWPVVETVQRDGICVEVLAPAPGLHEELAVAIEELAIRLAAALDVVGVLAVELFETPTGVQVNELAMRPHNSAHWTMDGSLTSQFEQHLRAVLDYPLGVTTMTQPVAVMANVLGGPAGGPAIDERVHELFAAEPGVKLHLYGKQVRPGRKIGHVTAVGDTLTDVRRRATRAAAILTEGRLP